MLAVKVRRVPMRAPKNPPDRLGLRPSSEERRLYDAAARQESDKTTGAWACRVVLREAKRPTHRVEPTAERERDTERTRLELRLGAEGRQLCDAEAERRGFEHTATWARLVLNAEARRLTSSSA